MVENELEKQEPVPEAQPQGEAPAEETPAAPAMDMPVACSNCGAPLSAGQLFCQTCGHKVEQQPVQPQGEALAEETPAAPAMEMPTACPCCGAPLTEGQLFCQSCGSKVELQPVVPVPDAIAQFNQSVAEQSVKKAKNKKLIITIAAIAGALLALFLVLNSVFSATADDIIRQIKSETPSVAAIEKDYDGLTPVGQLFVRDRIMESFVKHVSNNAYEPVSGELLNQPALEQYRSFKKIADILGISDSKDGTNVVKHIDAVLQLEEYEQYCGLYHCILASADDYTDCLEYISKAANSYSAYTLKLYVGYAYSDAKSAVSAAEGSSNGDELCTDYIASLITVRDWLFALRYSYSTSSYDISGAQAKISEYVSAVSDAIDEVDVIEEAIPAVQ